MKYSKNNKKKVTNSQNYIKVKILNMRYLEIK